MQPDVQYDTASAECWRAALDQSQLNHADTNTVSERRYAVGETKATTFDIYGHPENATRCLAPDEYPIDTEYNIAEEADSTDDDWEYRWGYTLAVAES